jgi:xanthine dehydrogenase YagT iron-sulfur-binding subunit
MASGLAGMVDAEERHPLAVGDPAPWLSALGFEQVTDGAGTQSGDVPTVLALFAEGDAVFTGEVEREAIRRELRALGAMLVAVSPGGLWCFRPDDEAQVLVRAPQIDAAATRLLFTRCGVDAAPSSGTGLRGLFVIDGKGIARFGHRLGAGERITLMTAVAAAGRAMLVTPAGPGAHGGASRREFLLTSLLAGFAVAVADGCARPEPPRNAGSITQEEVDLTLDINGQPRRLRVEPSVSLLDALRENLGLTGTKKGCDHGQCGACTVLVDGRRINSCLTLAVMAEGTKIATIEGLGTDESLHPMQRAFVAEDALQCGYCTPGQIMSAVGLVTEGHAHHEDDIRELMSGNICRCGAYPNIVTAIGRAQKEMTAGGKASKVLT